MPTATKDSDAIAKNLLDGIKRRLGDAWDNRLSDADRRLVEACVADAAELQLRAMALDPHDDTAHLALLKEKAEIKAQLLNIAAAEAVGILGAFENSMRWAVQQLVKLAFAAI
jgi:hypothetical protein